jgi:hypothetical protein
MLDSVRPIRQGSLSVLRTLRRLVSGELGRALLVSQALALGWWLVAVWLRGLDRIPVWYDQQTTFTQMHLHLANPYEINFPNPPWTAVLLIPFGLLPLPLSLLVQLGLYFAILTAITFKYKGSFWSALLALTSFIAFDSALELNIDWLACLGLLVPAAWSGPLLLIKPQVALSVWISFKRRDLVRALIVALLTFLASLVLWGDWLTRLPGYVSSQLRWEANIAPLALLPAPVAVPISLGWIAFRRRDPVLSILAGIFFVPYIKFYSLLLPLTLLAVRWPRLVLLVSVVMWIIYGGVIGLYFSRL